MKLKGKQVEDFVKAIEESKKMNKTKENSDVKGYMSFTKEELAKLKDKEYNAIHNEPNEVDKSTIDNLVKYDFKDIKINPVLNKDCIVSTDWIEGADIEDEEEVPVKVVEVIKKCKCGGEFEYTPGMTQTLEYPPHYTHTCNKCGKVERFLKTYPYQKYKRIKVGAVND